MGLSHIGDSLPRVTPTRKRVRDEKDDMRKRITRGMDTKTTRMLLAHIEKKRNAIEILGAQLSSTSKQ